MEHLTVENMVKTLGTLQLQLVNAQGYIETLEAEVKRLREEAERAPEVKEEDAGK